MPKVNFENERKILDRQITFFHLRRARRRIDKCIKLARGENNEFFLYYFLGQKKILKEEYQEAIKYIDKALKVRSSDGCTYNDKALCLADLGKKGESLECFNKGIRLDPNCASLYHNKGWLLNSLSRHSQAVLCFHKALELDLRRPEALYSLADSYFHLKDNKRAAIYFKKALNQVKGKSSFVCQDIKERLKSLNL